MKFTLDWLKEHLDTDASPAESHPRFAITARMRNCRGLACAGVRQGLKRPGRWGSAARNAASAGVSVDGSRPK